mmetsp:Transcript_21921/g.30128  ORF Transcript_21921/g.30128 Transcript_21921/m.30128 type:complete len:129 (-) Transcript_21921:59-445(-)
MPRFYCDYCDAYLTHDSMTGRQQHMRGWKHRENFRNHYLAYYQTWIQVQQTLQIQQMQMQMMHPMFMPPNFMPPGMPGMEMMMSMGMGNLNAGVPSGNSDSAGGDQQLHQMPPPPHFRPPPSVAPPTI